MISKNRLTKENYNNLLKQIEHKERERKIIDTKIALSQARKNYSYFMQNEIKF
jgi:hypothetical protein